MYCAGERRLQGELPRAHSAIRYSSIIYIHDTYIRHIDLCPMIRSQNIHAHIDTLFVLYFQYIHTYIHTYIGGMVALVGCILSHDYQKRRHGCRALANIALSVHVCKEMEQVQYVILVTYNRYVFVIFAVLYKMFFSVSDVRMYSKYVCIYICIYVCIIRWMACYEFHWICLCMYVCFLQVFENKALLNKVLKMAIRAEIQTQQEVSYLHILYCSILGFILIFLHRLFLWFETYSVSPLCDPFS